MTHLCPTRTPLEREVPARHLAVERIVSLLQYLQLCAPEELAPYLLFELLMNGIQSILDGHSFHVPCSDFKSKRKMKVNLLDRRCGKVLLQHILLIQCCWRGVQLPKDIMSALDR